MQEPFNLTDELRLRISGREGNPTFLDIEKGHVKRFAEAISDPNPLWTDEEIAFQGPNRGLTAPPTFLRVATNVLPEVPELESLNRLLDAGSEWEFQGPVYVGETITAISRITNIRQRTISVGPAVFLQSETTYSRQDKSIVALQRSTVILYAEPED
jgi:acyl dehydratase